MSYTAKDAAKDAADVLRAASKHAGKRDYTAAIIVAGGNGTRMGTETTKQMLELCGKPIVVHTLLAYQNTPCIGEIVVAAKQDEIDLYWDFKQKYGITKLTAVVEGGVTRQASALAGVEAVSDKVRYVAIADAARCLTTPEEISEVCRVAYKTDAASAGIPATDTVKIVEKSGYIASTPERALCWQAQTPQVFRHALYLAASYAAIEHKFTATDDNSLIEFVKHPVKMVKCSKQNIKITEPCDLPYAQLILDMRQKESEAQA